MLANTTKRKAYHRKIHGGHHNRSKRYLKTYWPYIPMLMVALFAFGLNAVFSSSSRVLGASQDFSQSLLLKDTNTDRAQADVAPLRYNGELAAAAQSKADDMVKSNYWSHNSPSGKTPWSFIVRSGYMYQKACYSYSHTDLDRLMSLKWVRDKKDIPH